MRHKKNGSIVRQQADPRGHTQNRTWGGKAGRLVLLGTIFLVGTALFESEGRAVEREIARMKPAVIETETLFTPTSNGGIKIPEGVELFEDEGQDHVADGVHVFYKTDPPTSGAHSSRWLPASVYGVGEAKPELLVHNLEHGNIVIYFDRSVLSQSDLNPLFKLAKKHIGQWDGILLVGREDKEHPIILTAWRAMLRLKKVDMNRIASFVDTFRGRGPENRVR